MVEFVLQWLYAILTSVGLAGDPAATQDVEWRSAREAQPAPTDTADRHHAMGIDGDIYNGF